MELQPLVGSDCAHCHQRVLVDADGRNCARCGLALHRKCAKDHRAECTGTAAVAQARHDYDEVAPLAWTTRLIVVLALGAFAASLGLAMLLVPLPDGVTASSARTTTTWAALGLGVVVMAAGYLFEASAQRPRR